MAGHPKTFIFLTLALALMNILFMMYNADLCPVMEVKSYAFEELNATGAPVYEDIAATKCDNLPAWLQVLINAPFLVGLGLSVIPF